MKNSSQFHWTGPVFLEEWASNVSWWMRRRFGCTQRRKVHSNHFTPLTERPERLRHGLCDGHRIHLAFEEAAYLRPTVSSVPLDFELVANRGLTVMDLILEYATIN